MMGVQLNIKSAEARELALELAALKGTSVTQAVIDALKAHKHELSKEERMRRIKQIVAEMRPHLSREFLEADDPTAILYDDETGLPA